MLSGSHKAKEEEGSSRVERRRGGREPGRGWQPISSTGIPSFFQSDFSKIQCCFIFNFKKIIEIAKVWKNGFLVTTLCFGLCSYFTSDVRVHV